MGVRSEGHGRSAGSNSDNIIVVGNQHEASRCMLVYDSVTLDREILARQDHLKNARLKTRTSASRRTRPRIKRFVILGRPACLWAYKAVIRPFKEDGPHATKQIWKADRVLPALSEIPMQSLTPLIPFALIGASFNTRTWDDHIFITLIKYIKVYS